MQPYIFVVTSITQDTTVNLMEQFQQPHLTVPVIKASFPETILAKLLSPEQFNIIQYIDGRSTVTDLAARLGVALGEIISELRKLVALEVVGTMVQSGPPSARGLGPVSNSDAMDLLDAVEPLGQASPKKEGNQTVIVGKIVDADGAVLDHRHPSFAPPSAMSQASMEALSEIELLSSQDSGWTPPPKDLSRSIEIRTGWTESEVPCSASGSPAEPLADETVLHKSSTSMETFLTSSTHSSSGMSWPRSSAWHDAVVESNSSGEVGPAHGNAPNQQGVWNTSDFQSLSYGGYSYEPEPLEDTSRSSWSNQQGIDSATSPPWADEPVREAAYQDSLPAHSFGTDEDLGTRMEPRIESGESKTPDSEALNKSVEREPWHRRWLFMDAASRVALPSAGDWKRHLPAETDPDSDSDLPFKK
ncbi:MAG: hypothetical protein EP343_34135 [Deltaproteobacteria bacterium]|nr:MAG: hypothetical protein EP343_34135 [Deltaproteobacteria bacterium]